VNSCQIWRKSTVGARVERHRMLTSQLKRNVKYRTGDGEVVKIDSFSAPLAHAIQVRIVEGERKGTVYFEEEAQSLEEVA